MRLQDYAQNDSVIDFARMTAFIDELRIKHRISRLELLSTVDPQTLVEHIVVSLGRRLAYVPGDEQITVPRIVQDAIIVPDTWWDAFKEKHFDVLKRWFPVRWRQIQEHRVIQRAQTYEARQYLTGLEIPEAYAGPIEIMRMLPLDKPI